MPEVIIKASNEWFPSDQTEKIAGHTKKQEVTLAIAQKMPELVVRAFKDLSLDQLTPSGVVYDITKFHALCSINQPDIAITIFPAWTEARDDAKTRLVTNIWHDLRLLVTVDLGLDPGSVGFPCLDIMVKFVNEAGVALDKHGNASSRW